MVHRQRKMRRRDANDLYVAGKLDAAIETMSALIADHRKSQDAEEFLLLSLFLFSKREWAKALEAALQVHEMRPDDTAVWENISLLLRHLGRNEECLEWLLRALEASPNSPNVHDGLAHIYGRLGQLKKAQQHGEQALLLKDAEAAAVKPLCSTFGRPITPFQSENPERNVIAFSLWGNKSVYLDGAVRNAQLAPEIYPEWRCRFYCGTSVPEVVVGELMALGVDVVLMPEDGPLFEGLFWRFQIASDRNVDRFLVRDVDSLINPRERAAVNQWLESNKHYHVLRD